MKPKNPPHQQQDDFLNQDLTDQTLVTLHSKAGLDREVIIYTTVQKKISLVLPPPNYG